MYNYNKVIIHWYSGDLEILDKLINLGCYFTVSVDIGYSDITYKILDKVPLNRLLIETDGPTALEWVNGEYGYPSVIIDLLRKVSDYKNISNLNEVLIKNYNNLLNL